MEIGGVLRTVFQIEVGREKALAFDLVTTLPRHVLQWGGANLGINQTGESAAGRRAQPFDSSGNKRFGKTATGLVHSRKRTENGKYGYPEREERTGKHTPLPGPTSSSAWLFDPGERSGLPCLRSSPSPFAVDHHRLPDSFPRPGTWPRPFGVFERIELLSSSPYARFGWQALFRQFASSNRRPSKLGCA